MIQINDFTNLLKGLIAAYPRENFMPNEYTMTLWYNALGDIEYPLLNRAIQSYILSNRFPPTIADIRQMAYNLSAPADDLAGEEWAKLMRAMGYAGSPEAAVHWERLSDITRSIVGGFSEFKEWANTPTADLMSVQRPMFIKRYEDAMKTERMRGAVPASMAPPVRRLVENTAGRIEQKSYKPGGGVEAPADRLKALRERLGA